MKGIKTLFKTEGAAEALAAVNTKDELETPEDERWTYKAVPFGERWVVAMRDETGAFIDYM